MRTPKISVVMPSLNVAKYICECMDSVVNQTLKELEIICVDAGSTDGTLEILREYAEKDERVRVIVSDKKSYGYQVNLGLKEAHGEYFAIVETDDYIDLNMYKILTDIADKNNLEVLKADFQCFVGDGDSREFFYAHIAPENLYNVVIDVTKDFRAFNADLVSWAGIYDTAFLKNNDIYHNETPGASYQDNGFWFQVFSKATRVMFYDHPFYHLRRDNENSSVFSKGKVYCMCDEYDFIREKIRDNKNEKKLAELCALYRYYNYNFTLNRIADEYRLDFIKRYSADFRKIEEADELNKSLFGDNEWERLQRIINEPEFSFYYYIYIPAGEEITVEQKFIRIQEKLSYKIGCVITWIPRKIRDFLIKRGGNNTDMVKK